MLFCGSRQKIKKCSDCIVQTWCKPRVHGHNATTTRPTRSEEEKPCQRSDLLVTGAAWSEKQAGQSSGLVGGVARSEKWPAGHRSSLVGIARPTPTSDYCSCSVKKQQTKSHGDHGGVLHPCECTDVQHISVYRKRKPQNDRKEEVFLMAVGMASKEAESGEDKMNSYSWNSCWVLRCSRK